MRTAAENDYYQTLYEEVLRCRPWIEAALERSAKSHSFEDVLRVIMQNDAHLWATENGCCVTCITAYPLSKVLQIWLLGGDFDEVYNEHNAQVEQWAKSHDCDHILVNGRKGWARRLKDLGYEYTAAILIKEILP